MTNYRRVLVERARAVEPLETRSDYLAAQNRLSLAKYRQRRIAHDLGVSLEPTPAGWLARLKAVLS